MPVPISTEILDSLARALPDDFKYSKYRLWIPPPPPDEYDPVYGLSLSMYEFLRAISEELQLVWQEFSSGLKLAMVFCAGGTANFNLINATATISPGLLIAAKPFSFNMNRLLLSFSPDKFIPTQYLKSMLQALSSSLSLYIQLWVLAWFRTTTYSGGIVNWTMPGTVIIPGSWNNPNAFSPATGFQDNFGNYLKGGQVTPLNVDTMANFAIMTSAGILWQNTEFYGNFMRGFFTGFTNIWDTWISTRAQLFGGKGVGIGIRSPGLMFGVILNTVIQ